MPKSERCSVLSCSAPAGLLKECGALNLPNYCCFGCEGETNAENYTCRMKNNRVRADNKEGRAKEADRKMDRETDVRKTG